MRLNTHNYTHIYIITLELVLSHLARRWMKGRSLTQRRRQQRVCESVRESVWMQSVSAESCRFQLQRDELESNHRHAQEDKLLS